MSKGCKHCGSRFISWRCIQKPVGNVQDGRLRAHEVESLFVLGCDFCSETLQSVKGDEVAKMLTNITRQEPDKSIAPPTVEFMR